MNPMKTFLTTCLVIVMTYNSDAQNQITGRVIGSGEPLIGAAILVSGSNHGTTTDLDGTFVLKVDSVDIELEIISPGFVTLFTNGSEQMGDIDLEVSSIGLDEITVLASVAIDRKTAVAKSSVSHEQILETGSSQEFPELLKYQPGVYTSKQGGGFGDSRINVRGFDQNNLAVKVNGIPVNDMEQGEVYWSNGVGVKDVTTSVQVQRGLGASKLAIPSIGGTVNILTNTIEANAGGAIEYAGGNNGYQKTGFKLASGFIGKRWSFTLAGVKETSEGWVDGTQFEAYNYFLNISKQINDKHGLSFTLFGAPQRHGQRQNLKPDSTFQNAPQGIRYNGDWGYLNGQLIQIEDNFYHKPQAALNHYWIINDHSELATAAYVSIGRGGGGGTAGAFNAPDSIAGEGGRYRYPGYYGAVDLDRLVEVNQANVDGSASVFLRASHNDHFWTGVLSTYTNHINEHINFKAGLDLRYYVGKHYRTITHLLGADYVLDNSDVNNPGRQLGVGDKFFRNYDGKVSWVGGFMQGEYSKDGLTIAATFSGANTSYQRIDYFNFLDSDPGQETSVLNFLSYTAKLGINYNLNKNHNLFANVGHFTRPPIFRDVFDNTNNVNEDAQLEKVLGMEMGYGFRSRIFTGNANVYRTQLSDRSLIYTFVGNNGEHQFANISGLNAVHTGLELDFTYHPFPAFTITGMASFGNWTWQNDLTDIVLRDQDGMAVDTVNLYISGLKVGNAPQTSLAFGLDYELFHGVKVGANANYFANYYANFDPAQRVSESQRGLQSWKLPSFATVDLRFIYHFMVGNVASTFVGNVNNLFDTKYISDAQDGLNHDRSSARVFYGFGRTWTIGLEMKF